MKSLIENFPNHLSEALEIVKSTEWNAPTQPIENILITGLGGSGIGGTIVSELCKATGQWPISINKDYNLPNWVSEKTLVIACSYSGNTEETLSALGQAHRAGARIAGLTSGGKLGAWCKENGINHLVVPGGNPPRSMLGYSFVCLFGILNNEGLATPDYTSEINSAISLLQSESENIHRETQAMAKASAHKTVCVYANEGMGGVATRWRQQLNENSKMVGWDAAIPEMNHNELVGWAGGSSDIAVYFLDSPGDFSRNTKRMELSKEIVGRYTDCIFSISAKGSTPIEWSLYLINFGDWLSFYLHEIHGVDIMDIKVIDYLKGELEKF
jgi:glucose/mannose-6-phosphate isomerase